MMYAMGQEKTVYIRCWKETKVERKEILGKKACTREEIARRKNNTCTCMEYLTMLGLGFLQLIVMAGEPKTYKYRYLGLIEGDRCEET
jgi:hypothetical protein